MNNAIPDDSHRICPHCGYIMTIFNAAATCKACQKRFLRRDDAWSEIHWPPEKTYGCHRVYHDTSDGKVYSAEGIE